MTGRKELMGLARETNTDSTLLLLKSLQNSRPHPIVLRYWNIILRLLLREKSGTLIITVVYAIRNTKLGPVYRYKSLTGNLPSNMPYNQGYRYNHLLVIGLMAAL